MQIREIRDLNRSFNDETVAAKRRACAQLAAIPLDCLPKTPQSSELSLTMPAILLDQPTTGATTCIVIGGLGRVPPPDFGRYRAILWCVDTAEGKLELTGVKPAQAQVVPIDRVSPTEFASALERFVRLDPRRLPSLLITDRMSPAFIDVYQRTISDVHAHLESTHRARLTRQQDGFTWQRHVLQNAPAYVARRLPLSWAGALRGLPAFICGAGPSLDVSITKLVAAADRAVVFSADSALRALARKGVQADFAVSIDAAKDPAKCLPPDFSPSHVVLASISPPAWQEALAGERLLFLSGNQITDDWLATLGVSRTPITVTESCGSTAIELARYLGCDPIYLFGLDLAVDPATPARRHHQEADPGLYVRSNYDPTAQLPLVPGNYAETVPCFALGDWLELDARLAARTDRKIFNVNDRGARLRGTTLLHPDQFEIVAPAGAKPTPLSLLSLPNSDDARADTALTRLRAIGIRCRQTLPGLRTAFEKDGPPALAEAFRPIMLDPECGRALGAFALKLMPHLVPPIEGDHAFWQALLTEFEELAALAM